ncbi:MAG: flippase-like domain-containing protein [Candidatus Solibacter usitatus]|nr:flippase-like domain-containing protein [Candidatus Solibacter usitatus]
MNRIRLIILAAAAIIGALLIYRAKPQFDWGQFQAIFSQLHWGWFAASFCMVMLTYVGRALRWQGPGVDWRAPNRRPYRRGSGHGMPRRVGSIWGLP